MAKRPSKKKSQLVLSKVKKEYDEIAPLASRFVDELEHQMQQLIQANGISLSSPIQKRIKSWQSIEEKNDRKALELSNIKELTDLVGMRIIVQFTRDMSTIRDLIRDQFAVKEEYDTGERLREDQFGYSSIHFILSLPDAWLTVPTMSSMKGMIAEIQLRTTAQHIWAAASHTLQYKNESSVPLPVRRAIHRVSALLETVDLEFDRVLLERDRYRQDNLNQESQDEELNVDLLENILDANLPLENKSSKGEAYADVLTELKYLNITKATELKRIIEKRYEEVMKKDKAIVDMVANKEEGYEKHSAAPERIARNVYYTHAGLIRHIMRAEFGESAFMEVVKKRRE